MEEIAAGRLKFNLKLITPGKLDTGSIISTAQSHFVSQESCSRCRMRVSRGALHGCPGVQSDRINFQGFTSHPVGAFHGLVRCGLPNLPGSCSNSVIDGWHVGAIADTADHHRVVMDGLNKGTGVRRKVAVCQWSAVRQGCNECLDGRICRSLQIVYQNCKIWVDGQTKEYQLVYFSKRSHCAKS